MRLVSLKIHPNGKNGLESEELFFGDEITQLYGPNGSGKTPTVQSIAFCLGYPCKFREEIYRRCSKAVLVFSINGNIYEASRIMSDDVDIEVRGPVGLEARFYNEADYSEFMFELLEVPYPSLVSTSEKIVKPYLATILPLFYTDQDDGYRALYAPPSRFIKDQFSETIRLIFNLPAKNSFDQKKDRILAKQELDRLDEVVKRRQREFQEIKNNLIESDDEQALSQKILILEADLNNLKSSGDQHNGAAGVLDRLIVSNEQKIKEIEVDLREVAKRERSVNRIIAEINLELNALSLNEESRRVFLSFNEICESPACQLFSASSASYAKNLLYLKDQIKDLERNSDVDSKRIEVLNATKENLISQNDNLISERQAILQGSEINAVIEAVSKIKGEIFALQTRKFEFEKLKTIESRYFDAIVLRDKALEKYESFSNDRSSSLEITKLRTEIRSLFLNWLDVINTNNINRNISFKEDFEPIFGAETIVQIKGSTKVRAILAFHAALLEAALLRGRSLFKFLILDTPKQHDINNADLGAYVQGLKNLSRAYNVQIIFSNTEFHYVGDDRDVEWVPRFPGKEHDMFYFVPKEEF